MVRVAIFCTLLTAWLWSFANGHTTRGFGVINTRDAVSWGSGTRLPADQTIHLSFVLGASQPQIDTAVRALNQMSNPSSSQFAQHWTDQKVADHFAPRREDIRLVARWLNDSGLSWRDQRLSIGGHLTVRTTVGKAEQLLGARYHEYSDNDGTVHVAPDSGSYSVPTELASTLAFIYASSETKVTRRRQQSRNAVQPRQSKANVTSSRWDCLKYTTPECLGRLYNMPALSANDTAHPKSSFGIFQLAWQTWIPEELDAFFAEFRPELVGHQPTVLPINGGYRQTEFVDPIFNLEPHLDFEYGMALAYPQPVANIQVGGEDHVGNSNVMLAAFDQGYCEHGINETFDVIPPNGTDCGTLSPPLVISISAAWNEAAFSDVYLERQCLEYLKLALRGTSVIAATGDRGTADQMEQCRDPITGSPGGATGHFSATFPASCPWVTAVGGTQLSKSGNSTRNDTSGFPPETAFHLQQTVQGKNYTFTPGGGFSNVFSAPPYQQPTVRFYLDSPDHHDHLANLSSIGYFDPRGRGYPDVSAMALNYLVHSGGRLVTVSGTSASAPVFASMVARINDARLKAGKRPVGFLNSVLYSRFASAAGALRDTQAGFNSGCGVSEAFPASNHGWDAVTGLGSPDFGKLLQLFLSLP